MPGCLSWTWLSGSTWRHLLVFNCSISSLSISITHWSSCSISSWSSSIKTWYCWYYNCSKFWYCIKQIILSHFRSKNACNNFLIFVAIFLPVMLWCLGKTTPTMSTTQPQNVCLGKLALAISDLWLRMWLHLLGFICLITTGKQLWQKCPVQRFLL